MPPYGLGEATGGMTSTSSRPTGRCPFRLLSSRTNVGECAASALLQIGGSQSGCPFRSLISSTKAAGHSKEVSEYRELTGGSGTSESGDATSRREGPCNPVTDVRTNTDKECPLGFGSSANPKLDALNEVLLCPICHALFHDCVQLGCGHWACSFCVQQAGRCGKCGADAAAVHRDECLQGVVDLFINGHSTSCPSGGVGEDVSLSGDGQTDAGASVRDAGLGFLLRLGLQSMAGGNLEAACSRFQRCSAELRPMAAGDNANSANGRLAAVCGMLGDCLRGLGDHEGAVCSYREACAAYDALPQTTQEDWASMAALHAKIGDLQICQDLSAAEGSYRRALELRRRVAKRPSTEAMVELAVALVKVADVCRDTHGGGDSATELLAEAGDLLRALSTRDMADVLAFKCEQLHEYVAGGT